MELQVFSFGCDELHLVFVGVVDFKEEVLALTDDVAAGTVLVDVVDVVADVLQVEDVIHSPAHRLHFTHVLVPLPLQIPHPPQLTHLPPLVPHSRVYLSYQLSLQLPQEVDVTGDAGFDVLDL